ncbi:hypothetical protein F511_22825 [Dorcoceras hygrometricum]|uniref:Uncharacterized protein n=1 Tax=Dorcoceras hygrometricum TaxID=472368 RepID=A0A2Z7B5Z9_9LAMI|nr:hypothetical protein F511_22825 [Dorcoceras hygrometricum]
MKHAIINAMKCMRAIKDRIARPVYQLENQSVEPLYHPQCINRGNHRSVIFRARQIITARWYSDTTSQSITTPMIALDFSGTTTQSASHNVALNQNSKGTAQVTETNQLPPATAITTEEHPNLNLRNNQSLHFSSHTQNDAAPTNQNDVVALHQLVPNTLRNNQHLVTLNNPDASLIPDAISKTLRFNLSKRRRVDPTTGSPNPQLVTQTQHISQNFTPAASSNHNKHNYCQTQRRHAHINSTDFQNSPGKSYRSLLLPDFAKIRYVCLLYQHCV